MFDPFKDFEAQGYLRNRFQEKDFRIIKQIEHEVFLRNAPVAQRQLQTKDVLTYDDFLETHRILFSEFYPWAGKDRAATSPESGVKKGETHFAHPSSSRLAVEQGLRLGQEHDTMNRKPGEIMGLFAYGHPFLDGNGRTMLLVHIELSHRAGFSIDWAKTEKLDYLQTLSREIEKPGCGILDDYLLRFKGQRLEQNPQKISLSSIKGLDGRHESNQLESNLNDPIVAEEYRRFDERRGYSYVTAPLSERSGAELTPKANEVMPPKKIATKKRSNGLDR